MHCRLSLSEAAANFLRMPSFLHEALVQMFRNRPSLAPELLTNALGVTLPTYNQVRFEATEFTDVNPTEFRADAVVTLARANTPTLAVVVEAQLSRDKDKRWSWPVYLSTLRSRLRCPTILLVMCVDDATAAWCANPIVLGHPGWVLSPLTLGPDRIPMIDDGAKAAQAPELAVLSALAHGGGPAGSATLSALASALAIVDADRGKLYADVVLAALPVAARNYLEALMTARTYEYQSDFARRYVAQGMAEGEATAVLEVLDERKIVVPDDARERISTCTDLDQLKIWIRRAVTAESIGDLFD
jgi:hypothetical protein